MTQPGERDRLVAFERPVARTSAMGRETAKDFSPLCSEWAKVLFGTGAERRQAGVDGASQAATFIVPDNSATRGVTPRDTIWFDDLRWSVTGNVPVGADRHITAVAGKG